MGANYQLGVAEKLVMKESPHKASSLILIALNQLQVCGAAGAPCPGVETRETQEPGENFQLLSQIMTGMTMQFLITVLS